ncbi:ABC transporter substrate-binding protein [Desulfoplanes sp.]
MRYQNLLFAIVLSLSMFIVACSNEPENALERVSETEKISFAMSGGYPPFNFYNDKNELVGFDVDVAKEVAKRLGVTFEPVTTEWSGIIEGLRAGTYDGILGSMAVTPQREKVVDFSVPYYYSGAQVIARTDAPETTPQGFKGKVIGLVTGTTFEDDAKKLGAGEIRLYKDDTQTLMELDNGVIDAVITDRVVGVNALNKGTFDLKLVGTPIRSEDIAVAFRKSDSALREKVNAILNDLHTEGVLSRLSQKWLGVDITSS